MAGAARAPCSLSSRPPSRWRPAPEHPGQFGGAPVQQPAEQAPGATDRHRPDPRRLDPAAIGAGQCRCCRTVDEERRRNGACRIQGTEHPAAGEGRRRYAARRATGRPAGDRGRRRNHHRSAVCAIGKRRRRGRAHPQYPGDRILHRRQRRRARRLSVELPAGVRRPAHRRLRHLEGQAFVRRA